MWSTLYHTGPLVRECKNVKQHLYDLYNKHKNKYSANDVFHKNFRNSFKLIDTHLEIVDDNEPFECMIDDNPIQISNPYLESPCVFVGNHPLRGTCKLGVNKKDVIINVSPKYTLFLKKRGFSTFVHNPDVRWFVSWNDEITNEKKYLFIPYDNKENKFENARKLKKILPKIRKRNLELVQSNKMYDIQLGLVSHLIDTLCIRIGNENEYDTVGACTIDGSNVHILPNNKIHFVFNGKDHIPFNRVITMNPFFYDALVKCKEHCEKHKITELFELMNPGIVNRYLSSFKKHITAKMFRTCKASTLFQKEYRKHGSKKKALLKVAKALNHKKMDKKKKKYVYNLNTSWNNYIDHRIYDDPMFKF
jgi:hypothetical protein